MFDIKKLIRIKTNMLNLVIKVDIFQKYKNKWYLVIYLLKKFLSVKQNSNIYYKKLLIIVILLEI